MKKWLTERFLPMWAKETVLLDNRLLTAKGKELEEENRRLRAYIRGMQTGLRAAGRVHIQDQGGRQ